MLHAYTCGLLIRLMFAKFDGFEANVQKDTIFIQADRSARGLSRVINDKVKIDVSIGDLL